MKKQNRGFTFIEILITMGIMVLLSASMFQIVSVSKTQRGLILNLEEVKSGVRLAQSYALSNPQDLTNQRDICGFGVHPNGSTMIVYYLHNSNYKNDSDACDTAPSIAYSASGLSQEDIKTINLDSGYTASGDDIYFKVPYGGVYAESGGEMGGAETRSITVSDSNGQSELVTVNGGGKISLQ